MLYINDAIHQWEASRDIWVVEFDVLTGESENTIEDNNKLCEKLKALRDRMQYHYTNVTALRDGLFNASAVMESRASTRLGGQTAYPPPSIPQIFNILTPHRKRKTPHIRQHLLPPSRLLHLPLEHERDHLPPPHPDLRHHLRRPCHVPCCLQSQHPRQTLLSCLRIV